MDVCCLLLWASLYPLDVDLPLNYFPVTVVFVGGLLLEFLVWAYRADVLVQLYLVIACKILFMLFNVGQQLQNASLPYLRNLDTVFLRVGSLCSLAALELSGSRSEK